MYLTRFRVNSARTGARRLLSSPQSLHAAVMCSFAQAPTAPTGSQPRVLWRVDHNAATDIVLYIAGPRKPDLTHLVEQAGWPTTGGWETFAYAPFLDRIAVGDVWQFRLTANPVHSIRRNDSEPTKRTAHLTPRHQLGWLLKHQERAGFTVVEKPQERRHLPQGDEYDILVRNHRDLSFGKRDPAQGRLDVKIVTATYDGRLRVTDADALRRTLTAGLGKAKAYGCGLMTLAPAA
jgi:CRISPR system Cascade subunit CasE